MANQHSNIKDLTGQIFGRLTVVSFSHIGKSKFAVWNCKCICGRTTKSHGNGLRSGRVQSCGCLRKTHGLSHAPNSNIWYLMKARCENPKHHAFKDYGARGITICERWQSIENFLNDMGPRPSPKHMIERRDNNRGYSPDNCYWATLAEQARNRRNNHWLTFRGETLLMTDWAARTGITVSRIWRRLYKHNWSVEKALSTPVRQNGHLWPYPCE